MLRIIILEIHSIGGLMTKTIVRNLVYPYVILKVFEVDDILRG